MAWFNHPVWIVAILLFNLALSEWLALNTRLRGLGTALLVILVTAVTSNLGIIPTNSIEAPVYNGIFTYVAPIGIFLLLLEVNLKNLKAAGSTMIILFLIGMAGTTLGVLFADYLVNAKETIGDIHYAISGMFTGTYTGGSINFNAIALHYKVNETGNLFAGAVAIDNIITTIWMIATLGLPVLLNRLVPRKKVVLEQGSISESALSDEEKFGPFEMGILLGLGFVSYLISETSANYIANAFGINIPSILILTTIALVLAQFQFIQNLKGARLLGLVSMYLFLAVIGAFCDLGSIYEIGSLAVVLLLYVAIIILIHGATLFGIGAIFKMDWIMISIASQANVGGSTSALALARSLKRHDLMLPAVLIGVLGNGLGTYIGFLVAEWLK